MARYQFDLAGPNDDAALRCLMAQTPMDGSVSLTFHREPGYFDANCVLGRDCQTIVCRDTLRKEIVGLGTRSVRDLWINGRIKRIGYLSSLRSVPHARSQGLLARGYRFLRELHESDPVAPDFYLTTIAEKNRVAIDQLTSRRAGLPTYHQLCRFHTLVLPVIRKPAESKLASAANCHVSPCDSLEDVVSFLCDEGPKRTFFPAYQLKDFDLHKGTFRGLAPTSIRVASRNGRIIGTAGVWCQRHFRQTRIRGYTPILRWIRPAANLWSRFTGGIQLPDIGSELAADYVCFPVVANNDPAVLRVLLKSLMRIAGADTACLLLGFCEDDPMLTVARRMSHSEYTTFLYAVNWSGFPDELVGQKIKDYYLELGCL